MREWIRKTIKMWRSDYLFRTITSSAFSALINFAFTLFNGILGIVYLSLWNGSICVYYFLLAGIRAIIVNAQRKEGLHQPERDAEHHRSVYIKTHILLLLMDISLVVPVIVMVNGERSYTYGLIPAISMASYTTYRIIMGVIQFHKSRKSSNILVSELRMINLTDALLALLTTQNALIIANGGMSSEMKTLTAWTSAGILIEIVVITVRSFLKVK